MSGMQCVVRLECGREASGTVTIHCNVCTHTLVCNGYEYHYLTPNMVCLLQTQTALATSNSVEGVASHLSSHLNHLHISTTSPYTPAAHQPTTAYATPQPTTYQIAPQGASQYAQQTPGGWTFSHAIMAQQVSCILWVNHFFH